MEKIKLAPSKARILKMPIPILIEHYALIQLKKSSLSSSQRAYVENRINFQIEKGNIFPEELEASINNLKHLE